MKDNRARNIGRQNAHCGNRAFARGSSRRHHQPSRQKTDPPFECKQLLDHMLDAFALYKVERDEQKQPTRYSLVNVNPAFKRLADLAPSLSPEDNPSVSNDSEAWITLVEKAAITGEPSVGLRYCAEADSFAKVSVFRPSLDYVGVILEDITDRLVGERKAHEEFIDQAHKMQTIGRMAAGIAHDFNNLLQAILGYSSMLQWNNRLDTASRDGLKEIEQAAHRASDLVQQILAFSRQIPTRTEPLDMNALTLEAIKLIRKTFPRNIDVKRRRNSEPAVALADGSQIHQVLINLCVNARDAMPRGGELCIAIDVVRLDKTFVKANPSAQPGKFVRCSVSDTGYGMDQETRRRAFEPFFTTRASTGSGLGLSTCYGIITAHNGLISIDSEVGSGTTVSIYLPASDKAALPVNDELGGLIGGTETILVVDDEDYIRRLSKYALETNGYEVVTAANGCEAISAIEDIPEGIDIMVLDLNMPEMGGIHTLAEIRARAPEVKVIISAGLMPPMEQFEPTDPPDGFIQKPHTPVQLMREIRRILDS